jgi:hypothetical protein
MTARSKHPFLDVTEAMQGLLDYPYECIGRAFNCEWYLQHHAGNEPEVWAVAGHEADERRPLTVLWVHRQRVLWVFSHEAAPIWYFSPFSRAITFHYLAEWEEGPFYYFTALPGYIPLSTTCNQCLGLLSDVERAVASINAMDYGLEVHYCYPCDSRRMTRNPDDAVLFRSAP